MIIRLLLPLYGYFGTVRKAIRSETPKQCTFCVLRFFFLLLVTLLFEPFSPLDGAVVVGTQTVRVDDNVTLDIVVFDV